ncbi:Peptidase M8, leishmanolysin [Dillenia turbinata]|uniref:Peptidase M8, leishmanolysin n=1 Tax=Dillenia turbinata TaxID=194707 RepID=A0AAN8UUU4_9MAGN
MSTLSGLKVWKSDNVNSHSLNGLSVFLHQIGRSLLVVSSSPSPSPSPSPSLAPQPGQQNVAKQPFRIYLNYDAVGHSSDRDCQNVGDIVKVSIGMNWFSLCAYVLGRLLEIPPHTILCVILMVILQYLGTTGIIAPWMIFLGRTKDVAFASRALHPSILLPKPVVVRYPLMALGETADWFRRALAVEPVKGNLRLSGYSACGQDGGVQLPRQYVKGHVNVTPRRLTAEAETLLSATLIREVMHVLGFDPHAFAHFWDERKRWCDQAENSCGWKPKSHKGSRSLLLTNSALLAFSENFTGLELEGGGGHSSMHPGSHWEKRLLMNEIMIGSVDTRSVVSKMTLALLEDSGWYKANYSIADCLDWGCTYIREAEGYCPIVSYSGDIPQWPRYFPQACKGGQSSLADYCTYFVAYSDGSCTDINSAQAPDRMLGKVRGSNSRCMASALVRTGFVRRSTSQGNGCYQHCCVSNSLEVCSFHIMLFIVFIM